MPEFFNRYPPCGEIPVVHKGFFYVNFFGVIWPYPRDKDFYFMEGEPPIEDRELLREEKVAVEVDPASLSSPDRDPAERYAERMDALMESLRETRGNDIEVKNSFNAQEIQHADGTRSVMWNGEKIRSDGFDDNSHQEMKGRGFKMYSEFNSGSVLVDEYTLENGDRVTEFRLFQFQDVPDQTAEDSYDEPLSDISIELPTEPFISTDLIPVAPILETKKPWFIEVMYAAQDKPQVAQEQFVFSPNTPIAEQSEVSSSPVSLEVSPVELVESTQGVIASETILLPTPHDEVSPAQVPARAINISKLEQPTFYFRGQSGSLSQETRLFEPAVPDTQTLPAEFQRFVTSPSHPHETVTLHTETPAYEPLDLVGAQVSLSEPLTQTTEVSALQERLQAPDRAHSSETVHAAIRETTKLDAQQETVGVTEIVEKLVKETPRFNDAVHEVSENVSSPDTRATLRATPEHAMFLREAVPEKTQVALGNEVQQTAPELVHSELKVDREIVTERHEYPEAAVDSIDQLSTESVIKQTSEVLQPVVRFETVQHLPQVEAPVVIAAIEQAPGSQANLVELPLRNFVAFTPEVQRTLESLNDPAIHEVVLVGERARGEVLDATVVRKIEIGTTTTVSFEFREKPTMPRPASIVRKELAEYGWQTNSTEVIEKPKKIISIDAVEYGATRITKNEPPQQKDGIEQERRMPLRNLFVAPDETTVKRQSPQTRPQRQSSSRVLAA